MANFRDQVLMKVVSDGTQSTEEFLLTHHAEAQQELSQKLTTLQNRILNSARLEQKALQKIDYRSYMLIFEKFFLPLETARVMIIYGITKDNAYQLKKRYRNSLPTLLPQSKEDQVMIDEYFQYGTMEGEPDDE